MDVEDGRRPGACGLRAWWGAGAGASQFSLEQIADSISSIPLLTVTDRAMLMLYVAATGAIVGLLHSFYYNGWTLVLPKFFRQSSNFKVANWGCLRHSARPRRPPSPRPGSRSQARHFRTRAPSSPPPPACPPSAAGRRPQPRLPPRLLCHPPPLWHQRAAPVRQPAQLLCHPTPLLHQPASLLSLPGPRPSQLLRPHRLLPHQRQPRPAPAAPAAGDAAAPAVKPGETVAPRPGQSLDVDESC